MSDHERPLVHSVRAWVCHAFGELEGLRIEPVGIAPPCADEVRIRVAAAGLNFPDVLQVKGLYQERPPFPFVLGSELAGTVLARGEAVRGLTVGARIMAITYRGALAEQINLRASQVRLMPPGMTFVSAACFHAAYATALYSLKVRAMVQPGETALVLGAAGGVGLAAVQVAAALGAKVIAVASSADRIQFARQHGASEGIDYRAESLRTRVLDITNGRGVDIVIDPVGGALFNEATRLVAWNGRYVVVGFASGHIGTLRSNLTLLKGYALLGAYYGRFCEMQPREAERVSDEIVELYERGAIEPQVTAVYPFERAVEALKALEQRQARGKIAVAFADPSPN